ncbi:MAG: GGDEF domain-containing protein, partial [Deltaproteobacteria bacterium]|nr:GGDEF domain-containing protein [Deltaproteobacteria bacterium]
NISCAADDFSNVRTVNTLTNMTLPTNPSEIARETLKLLMSRRMAPSPENYRSIYNEIAGTNEKPTETFPDRELKSLIAALPKEIPVQKRLSRELDQALKGENWEDYKKTLVEFIKEHSAETELNWSDLIAELLRQWEAKQSNLTPARKRESLEHVLAGGTKNSEILFGRLQRLVKSWSLNSAEPDELSAIENNPELPPEAPPPAATPTTTTPLTASRASEILPELRELFAFTMEAAIASQLADEPDLAAEARRIAASIKSLNSFQATQELMAAIKRLAYRLEFLAEDRNELRSGLLKLLQLMVENVGEL